jgi:Domain of unknown function (DUF4129)
MAGTGGPLISRLRGQQLARRELARSIYRPSLLARIWHDVTHWLGSLVSTTPAGSLSWLGLILAAVALAAVVATVGYWLGPASVNKRVGDQALTGTAQRSAGEHRDAADQLAAGGNYAGAIVERIRAIVADLEVRDVLLRQPARTAMELASDAGAAFPAEAAELVIAAHGFDDVRYGGRLGSAAAYRRVRDLDVRLASAAATPPDLAHAPAALPALPFTPESVHEPPAGAQ